MRYNKVRSLWLPVLAIAAAGILTACASGSTAGDTTEAAPVVGDKYVYAETDYSFEFGENSSHSRRHEYDENGVLVGYARKDMSSGDTVLEHSIRYTYENGVVVGAQLQNLNGIVDINYEYDGGVLKGITLDDEDAQDRMEAFCNSEGLIEKIAVIDRTLDMAFTTYVYSYHDNGVVAECKEYLVEALYSHVSYDENGNVLEEISYNYEDGTQKSRKVYTRDKDGNATETLSYDADNKLKIRETSLYDEHGNLTETRRYNGDGAQILQENRYYTYSQDQLTELYFVRQDEKGESRMDFALDRQDKTTTVTVKSKQGSAYAEAYSEGYVMGKYTVDDSGEIIEKIVYASGGAVYTYRYQKIPVPENGPAPAGDIRMLLDILYQFND